MKDYELMLIVKSDLSEEDIGDTLKKLKEIIAMDGGELERLEEWGRRTLAYPIKGEKEGYYALFLFRGPVDLPTKLRREMRLNPSILRGMILRREVKDAGHAVT